MTAVDVHKAAWAHITKGAPCGERPFLFDFRFVNGKPFILSRPLSESSPLGQDRGYRLVVRLAPVRRSRQNRKIVERFVGEDQILPWTTALLARHGLRLEHVHQMAWESLDLGKPTGKRHRRHILRTALLSFDAVVVDADLAARAWGHGIGRHRAWGCGTLVLKRESCAGAMSLAS